MDKLEGTQKEVMEVKDIVLDIPNKGEERKERMEKLDQRSAVLLNKGKLEEAQREVEEVKDIMLDTVTKAEERKQRIEDLDHRAAVLLNKSQSFQKKSKKVKPKRKEYLRSKAGLIAFMVILALVIIITIGVMFSSERPNDTSVQKAAVTSNPNITEPN